MDARITGMALLCVAVITGHCKVRASNVEKKATVVLLILVSVMSVAILVGFVPLSLSSVLSGVQFLFLGILAAKVAFQEYRNNPTGTVVSPTWTALECRQEIGGWNRSLYWNLLPAIGGVLLAIANLNMVWQGICGRLSGAGLPFYSQLIYDFSMGVGAAALAVSSLILAKRNWECVKLARIQFACKLVEETARSKELPIPDGLYRRARQPVRPNRFS